MAELVMGPAIEALVKQVISLSSKLWGSGSAAQEYEESRRVLLDLVTLLDDCKKLKYRSDELIMNWYQDVKYLVDDLQEVVADLKEDMEQHRGILRRIKKVLKPNSTLKDELKAISTRIQQGVYGREKRLLHVETKEDSVTKPGPTPSDRKIFGRESKKEAIFNLLKTPSSYRECVYDFISIVGMGGIGKTTLAQHVYCDDSVASFPVRAWFHVSTELNQCEIYRSIIEQQLRSQCLIEHSFSMEEKLREVLKGKKFLIVIDNYRNESVQDFDALRAPFMAAAPGSKFIVTTRNRAVAKRFTAEESIIDLGLLSNEDSLSLFLSGSRLAENSASNLVIIAKEICEKCNGLPLALSVMNGLLSGIDDEAGWRAVLDDLISGKISDVHSMIKKSYWELPEHLKPCLSFCNIFLGGHGFEKRSTVDLWIYAGIIKCENQSSEEDVGGRWFDEIVSRSLLTRNPWGYEIHDIVKKVIMECSGEIYGRWEENVGSWDKIRHVSISKHMTAKALDELKYIPKERVRLKTLFIDCEDYDNDDMMVSFLKWKHLRVLEMYNSKFSKLSKRIVQMKQLRKLVISNIYDLRRFPVISKLKYLTEIDIIDCKNLRGPFPANLCNLTSLKRISLKNCYQMRGPIPLGLGNLTALTYLSLYGSGPIPSELGNLTALTYLDLYLYGDGWEGTIPSELGNLTALTSLCLLLNGNGWEGTIPSELGNLTALTYLCFDRCGGLTGHIPPKLGNLTALTSLIFDGCGGLTGPIPLELVNLTALEYLSMDGCKGLTGPILMQLGDLRALIYLNMKGCIELTGNIPAQLGELTSLKYLSMEACEALTGSIPSELGPSQL